MMRYVLAIHRHDRAASELFETSQPILSGGAVAMGVVSFAPQSCCAVGATRTQRAKRMNRRSICRVAALAALAMLASWATAQTLNGFDLKNSLVPPDQIL